MNRIFRETATILIVDDDPTMLGVTAEILNRFGYTVLTAQEGSEGLKAFEEAQNTIQLVISDVVMPGMNGPQLVRSIKSRSPSTATLLMSGTLAVTSDVGEPLISKPFTLEGLLGQVQALLAACDFARIEQEQTINRSERLAAMVGTKREPRLAELG
jgi:two-component system, cell cycle sensor histidine kinase and response regulator CckA